MNGRWAEDGLVDDPGSAFQKINIISVDELLIEFVSINPCLDKCIFRYLHLHLILGDIKLVYEL